MAKRFIGIDIDEQVVRVAIIAEEKGDRRLIAAEKTPYADEEGMLAALRQAVGKELRLGDRIAAALPAREGFVRQLKFPFSDEKKIQAALDFELSTQLPLPMEQCIAAFHRPRPLESGGFQVSAAAVRTEVVRNYLAPLDRGGLALQILDLAPFGLAAGLRENVQNAVLVCLQSQETTVALIRDGRIGEYRLLPPGAGFETQEAARVVLREANALMRSARQTDLPLVLSGEGAQEGFAEALRRSGATVESLAFELDGQPLPAEFIPAIALAKRATLSEKEMEFNFRRGEFTLKSEWTALKKGLIAAGVVLAMSGLAMAGAAYLNYAHKAGRAEGLSKEMVRIYRQTFPASKVIVDIPMQMRTGIKELEKRGRLIGADSRGSALAILQEVSKSTPADLEVDVRDFGYTPESVRLEGYTSSFDAINRLARSLEQSAMFEQAQISDAKMSLDGSRVDFRINLSFSERAEN